jgi:hypothetical protein
MTTPPSFGDDVFLLLAFLVVCGVIVCTIAGCGDLVSRRRRR